jgi:hypothetical protein
MEFDVPPEFVFRWATDYRPDDATRSKEKFERRFIQRRGDRIRFEDLWVEPEGWGWRHYSIRLHPPFAWHADSFGNVRTTSTDYRVRPLPNGRSALEITLRRRPSPLHPRQPPKAKLEAELRTMWTNYGRAMLRDYRRSRRRT